jgi:alkylation response protein AidB-like acyl-CoA dehydrogenase
MDFGQSAEEKMLAEALSGVLSEVCSTARLRAWEAERVSFDDAFWSAMSKAGFLETGLPGSDCASFSVLALLEETAGRFLAPQVLSWHSAYAAFLTGERELAAAAPPGRAGLQLSDGRLSGTAEGVLFLDRAAEVALPGPGGDGLAFVRTSDVQAELVETQSLVPQWRISLSEVSPRMVPAPALALALTRLRACLAAWATGAAAQAIEVASAYARERRQFDHPIGSYQSVQNRLVDAAVQVEQARMLVYRAAALIDGGDPEAADLAVLARLQAGKAFVQASRAALLTHGGYGFTVDFDVQLYFRRAKEAQLSFEPRIDWPLAPAFRN